MGKDSTDDPFAPRDATVFRPRPGAGKRGTERAPSPEPRAYAPSPAPGRQPAAAAVRDFSAAGLNPLLQAASPLLILMGRLRTSLSNPDMAGLRRQTLEQVREFEERARAAIAQSKIDITFHRIGSMFCLFFARGPIDDLAAARRSDLKMFARFFHACLKCGVYLAPSQFETGFISTAHSSDDIERTGEIIHEVLLNL